MIENAIVNWLNNTNEKNYTLPFCQVLINEGHKILHVHPHGPGEFGKDIITIDPDENICAYALNTGNITKSKWNSKVFKQIIDLIELPPIHPSLSEIPHYHKAFLVTNGEIASEVKQFIEQMNQKNQKRKSEVALLDVIDVNQLLSKFIKTQGDFLPKELDNFYSFLSFYLENGEGFFPKEKFFKFLNNMIFKEAPDKIGNIKNAISSSVILTSYLLNPYQLKDNYYALFEAWTSLSACILRYCRRNELEDMHWQTTWNLIISEIERNLRLLEEETLKRETYIEGNPFQDGGEILRARTTILLGILAAFEIYLKIKDRKHILNDDLFKRIKYLLNVYMQNEEGVAPLWYWGESAFPFFFYIIKFLELKNEKHLADFVLQNIFKYAYILKFSGIGKKGIANPYYSVQDILSYLLEIDPQKINFKQFFRSSFIMETLILMLTRRDQKETLGEHWYKISYFHFLEFMPDKEEDFFNWYIKDGRNHTSYPNQTQSWTELKIIASKSDKIPNFYIDFFEFLIFFIIVCPHRVNKLIIGFLEQQIDKLQVPLVID